MKKIIIIIFAVVLIFTGIYFLENKKGVRGYRGLFLTEQDYINAAERYMKDKYGEKFEGEYLFEDDVYAYPVAHPEWQVHINVERKDGFVYFHDNYVGFLKKAELESYIHELVKPIYGECKVYVRPYGFPLDDSWDKNTDIMTYVEGGNYATYIFTYGNIEEKEANCKKICDIFIDKKLESNGLRIIYLTEDDLEKLEEKNIEYTFNASKYYYRIYVIYDKKSKTGFSEMDILKGDEDYGR
jgi:hypothetical protein